MKRCALVLFLVACGSDPETTTPEDNSLPAVDPARNLIVISMDTTRADHLGCYGSELGLTPRIDALADSGVRFSSAFTPMTITLPAHSSMMTSRHPRGLGVTSNFHKLPEGEHTLAERLQAKGYRTAAFISAPVLTPESGLNQGFEVFDSPRRGTIPAEMIYAKVREWIAEVGDEPYFCLIHNYDPHASYEAPEEYKQRFEVGEHGRGMNPPWDVLGFMRKPELLNDDVILQARQGYRAEVSYLDDQLAGFVEERIAAGALEDTVFFFVADHGETLDELSGEFGYVYDHGEFLHPRETWIPFVLLGPERLGLTGGHVYRDPVSLVDVMPTALECLGLPCEAPYEGRSLLTFLRGGEELDLRPIVTERRFLTSKESERWPAVRGDEFGITVGRWRYIRGERGDELYDLEKDPTGAKNLIAEKSDASEGLGRLLDEWLKKHPAGALAIPEEISQERREELNALGYGGDDEDDD